MSLPTSPPTGMAAYDGPTALARQLHGYPHYDFARHQVDVNPQSVVDNPGPYLQSLGSIAALPIILFLIFALFDLIIRTYYACRAPVLDLDSATYKSQQYRCCNRYQPYWDRKWKIAMILGGMTLITVFVALGFLGSVNKDLDKAENAMYDAKGAENNLVRDGYDAIGIINSAIDLLVKLGSEDSPPFNRLGQSQSSPIIQALISIRDIVASAAQVLGSYIGTSSSYRFASDLIHYTDMGRNDLRAVMVVVFITFFLTFIPLLFIRTFFPTRRTCINIFQIFALVACFISWAAAMVMISISVGVADLCMDPNAYIKYYFRNSSPDTQATIDYIIYCPIKDQTASPLFQNLQQVQTQTHDINNTLSVIQPQFNSLNPPYNQSAQQFYTTNQQANILVGNVITDTSCTRLYNDYTIIVNTICKETLSDWYGVAVCLALSSLLYLIMRCFIRSRQRIVSGDVEGDGNMIFNKVDTPPQHVMNIQQSGAAAPIIVPTSFEQPLYPAPTQSFQQPLEPAPTSSFKQPLEPAPSVTFDAPLVPPQSFQQPLPSHAVAASAPPAEQYV